MPLENIALRTLGKLNDDDNEPSGRLPVMDEKHDKYVLRPGFRARGQIDSNVIDANAPFWEHSASHIRKN